MAQPRWTLLINGFDYARASTPPAAVDWQAIWSSTDAIIGCAASWSSVVAWTHRSFFAHGYICLCRGGGDDNGRDGKDREPATETPLPDALRQERVCQAVILEPLHPELVALRTAAGNLWLLDAVRLFAGDDGDCTVRLVSVSPAVSVDCIAATYSRLFAVAATENADSSQRRCRLFSATIDDASRETDQQPSPPSSSSSSSSSSTSPLWTPTWNEADLPHGVSSVAQLSCGSSHALLLSRNPAQVYSMGNGLEGQLGHGRMQSLSDGFALVEALDGLPALSVACGGSHSAVLVDGGILYTFGSNASGQLQPFDPKAAPLDTAIPSAVSFETGEGDGDFVSCSLGCDRTAAATLHHVSVWGGKKQKAGAPPS
ncbi:regulator of chromosome condensation 1/beta-lactamase-inhibitor protein II, partial [Zopfochytrium polystomum]